MEITDKTRKTAQGFAEAIQNSYSLLEQGLIDGAKIDTSKGSLFNEFSKINNFFDEAKRNESNDDFVKDVICYVQLQTEATQKFFEDERNEATQILKRSKYWDKSKEYFYIIAMNYIGYISGNYQIFANLLSVIQDKQPQFIDDMLEELQKESVENKPISDLKVNELFGIFAEIVEKNRLQNVDTNIGKMLDLRLFDSSNTDTVNEEYKNIKPIKTKNIFFPLDKINNNLCKIKPEKGKLKRHAIFDVGKTKAQGATVVFDIDYTELEKICPEVKELSPQEREIMNVMGSICYAGNIITTTNQVCKTMRGSTAGKKFRDDFDRILTKLSALQTTIDNKEAAKKLGYTKLTYKGSMMPIERVTAEINNKVVENAIHFFRLPPLIEYAITSGQYATLPVETYQKLNTDVHSSKYGAAIKNYIVRRIKYKHSIKKILLSTLYEECGITTKSAKYDSKVVIEKTLKSLKESGEISDYKMLNDCITFKLKSPQKV